MDLVSAKRRGTKWTLTETRIETLKRKEEIKLEKQQKHIIKEESRKILEYNLSGEFIREYVGIIIASRTTGINYRSISGVANNHKHRKTAGGFVWRFK